MFKMDEKLKTALVRVVLTLGISLCTLLNLLVLQEIQNRNELDKMRDAERKVILKEALKPHLTPMPQLQKGGQKRWHKPK